MARILGLDVGANTIGIAVSDETGTIAFPGQTIRRQEGWRRDMAAIRSLIVGREIGEIVVGFPLMMGGKRGVQTEKVDAFVLKLRNSVRIPIHLQDERLSTREAERVLAEADEARSDWKRVVDSVAACLILQAFLDRRRSSLPDTDSDSESDCDSEEANPGVSQQRILNPGSI